MTILAFLIMCGLGCLICTLAFATYPADPFDLVRFGIWITLWLCVTAVLTANLTSPQS